MLHPKCKTEGLFMATRVFYVACHCHLKDALNYLFTCLSTLLKLFKLRCCFVWFELAAVWLSFCVLFDVFCVNVIL